MPRLFVAIALPAVVREQLASLREDWPGARWVATSSLHLTLRFIGEVEDREARDIQSALGTVKASAFSMALAGVGRFPPRGTPRVLWAGVSADTGLARLQGQVAQAVDRGLAEAGPPSRKAGDEHPFSPHITLARLNGVLPGAVAGFLSRHSGFATGPWEVNDFQLFASPLGRAGAHYQVLASYPLATPG